MNDLLGHDDVKQRFAATLRHGRLASTYLFVGPEGVGKRAFAERLGAALLCSQRTGESLQPCGDCDSCRLSDAGTHPDLLRIARPEGRTTLPLELFIGPPDKRHREGFCHDIALRPLISDRRVAIIDDADDFGVETANALLKTLEEPPPRSLLILIGTSLARQLPTIRSRAQVVRFRPLSPDQVASVLEAPPHAMTAEVAQRLAEHSGGSISRALEISEGGLDAARDSLLRLMEASPLDANALARVLEEETKAVATEPRLRRRATRELLGAVVERVHGRLVEGLADPQGVDRSLTQLEACFDAEEAIERNGNQSAVAAHWAARLARP